MQTLSPTEFDKGIIFAQEALEIGEEEVFDSLWFRLADLASEMLIKCVLNKSYEKPQCVTPLLLESTFPLASNSASYARKIDDRVNWFSDSPAKIVRFGRIGSLRTTLICRGQNEAKDLIDNVRLDGISHSPLEPPDKEMPPGTAFIARDPRTLQKRVAVVCLDNTTVFVDRIKLPSKLWVDGLDFARGRPQGFYFTHMPKDVKGE